MHYINSLYVLISALFISFCYGRQSYRAAVYDLGDGFTGFDRNTAGNVTNRQEALYIVMSNVGILQKQAELASQQGADIFVFPEYGLLGRQLKRESTFYFLETIPDPTMEDFCPCDNPQQPDQELLYRLSSIAKLNNIYIAANMGDKQPCLKDDEDCPLNGHFQYNTEVVFNSSGCLVARYHKQHLFKSESVWWNHPQIPDISYFDTEFGRFGLMICFDAVFQSPATVLVEKYNVTDIIFSTAWMNVYPHFMSIAYHSGWARTMNVNYLMANLHNVENRLVGSGIFTADGVASYIFNMENNYGNLIISDVPKNQRKPDNYHDQSVRLAKKIKTGDFDFEQIIFGDSFHFVRLNGTKGTASVCQTNNCCYLEFERSSDLELYALGIFQGMHYMEGTYYLEVCVLTRCKDNMDKGCGLIPDSVITMFSHLNMTTDFDTPYQFPGVMADGFSFTNFSFIDNGNIKTILIQDMNLPLVSVSLMGRSYEKDSRELDEYTPPNSAPGSAQNNFSILYLLMSVFSFLFMF